jgi:hypothetical protein
MDDLETKKEEVAEATNVQPNTETVGDAVNTDDKSGETQGQESSQEQTPTIDELRVFAEELGLGEFAEVLGDNPEKLHKFLIAKEKKIFESGKSNNQSPDGQGKTEDDQSTPKRDQSVMNEIEKFEFKFKNPEDVDPELLQNLNSFRDQTFKYIEGLMSQIKPLDGIVSTFEDQRITTENTRFESSLSKLGKDYSEFVGEGTMGEITQAQLDMRNAIWDAKEVLKNGMLAHGLKLPSESRLVEKAAKMVLEEKKINPEKKKVINDAQTRQNQISLKHNSRKSESSLTSEEQAIRDFDKKKRSITGSD